ncbi:MAG: DNA-directed RNA polymerase subunit K [bacterium]|nr:DNA-directed RNA polymerase subunit K [bacterium]
MDMQSKKNIFIYTRMIGARVLQLAAGAPKLVKETISDVFELAKLEVERGVVPFEVKLPRKQE